MQWMSGKAGLMVTQMALAMLALLAVAFTPPAQGRILLVPLDGRPIDQGAISRARATPLAPGPLPGSWVVDGNRRLLSGFWARQILVVAAPAALCADG